MSARKADKWIAAELLLAVFLWGGNNVGVKYLVAAWPPVAIGCSRFLCAGLLLLALLHGSRWLGTPAPISAETSRALWWRGGLSLAGNVLAFNFAVRYTAVSHVALYLGAAPVWALLLEGRQSLNHRTVQRYGAAVLALAGVAVLFLPALKTQHGRWLGEICGLAASFAWTNYSRQCRRFAATLPGVEITAQTMWRAAVWLAPWAAWELWQHPPAWDWPRAGVQLYCILGGGVGAYVLWNNALRHWPDTRVILFNNLIPPSVMAWAWVCLGEPFTPTYGVALALILAGVLLGQADLKKILAGAGLPLD